MDARCDKDPPFEGDFGKQEKFVPPLEDLPAKSSSDLEALAEEESLKKPELKKVNLPPLKCVSSSGSLNDLTIGELSHREFSHINHSYKTKDRPSLINRVQVNNLPLPIYGDSLKSWLEFIKRDWQEMQIIIAQVRQNQNHRREKEKQHRDDHV